MPVAGTSPRARSLDSPPSTAPPGSEANARSTGSARPAAPGRGGDAVCAFEGDAEGEGVVVSDFAGDGGDGVVGVVEQVRREGHSPRGEVGERGLADVAGEAGGEGR